MSIKKRRLKNKFFSQIKIFVSVFLVILFILTASYLGLSLLFRKNNLFISPLSAKKDSQTNQVEQMLSKANIPYAMVENGPDLVYSVSLKDGSTVILTQNKNVQNQISSLQLILARLTIEGKRFKNLDFRYDKPVIQF
jgi:hypothetical protein